MSSINPPSTTAAVSGLPFVVISIISIAFMIPWTRGLIWKGLSALAYIFLSAFCLTVITSLLWAFVTPICDNAFILAILSLTVMYSFIKLVDLLFLYLREWWTSMGNNSDGYVTRALDIMLYVIESGILLSQSSFVPLMMFNPGAQAGRGYGQPARNCADYKVGNCRRYVNQNGFCERGKHVKCLNLKNGKSECRNNKCTFGHPPTWQMICRDNICGLCPASNGLRCDNVHFSCPQGRNCAVPSCPYGHVFSNRCIDGTCIRGPHDINPWRMMCPCDTNGTCIKGNACEFVHFPCRRAGQCKTLGCLYGHSDVNSRDFEEAVLRSKPWLNSDSAHLKCQHKKVAGYIIGPIEVLLPVLENFNETDHWAIKDELSHACALPLKHIGKFLRFLPTDKESRMDNSFSVEEDPDDGLPFYRGRNKVIEKMTKIIPSTYSAFVCNNNRAVFREALIALSRIVRPDWYILGVRYENYKDIQPFMTESENEGEVETPSQIACRGIYEELQMALSDAKIEELSSEMGPGFCRFDTMVYNFVISLEKREDYTFRPFIAPESSTFIPIPNASANSADQHGAVSEVMASGGGGERVIPSSPVVASEPAVIEAVPSQLGAGSGGGGGEGKGGGGGGGGASPPIKNDNNKSIFSPKVGGSRR